MAEILEIGKMCDQGYYKNIENAVKLIYGYFLWNGYYKLKEAIQLYRYFVNIEKNAINHATYMTLNVDEFGTKWPFYTTDGPNFSCISSALGIPERIARIIWNARVHDLEDDVTKDQKFINYMDVRKEDCWINMFCVEIINLPIIVGLFIYFIKSISTTESTADKIGAAEATNIVTDSIYTNIHSDDDPLTIIITGEEFESSVSE